MSDILDTALALAHKGLAVHWVRGKLPLGTGWSAQPAASPEQLRASYRPGYNLGVRPGKWSRIDGKDLAIIDVDVHGGREYLPAAEAALRDLVGNLPPTVRTGGGGLHLWGLVEPGKLPNQAAFKLRRGPPVGPGKYAWEVELLYSGKQVVVPPSRHPETGEPYVWLHRNGSLPDLPAAVINAALQPLRPTPVPLQRQMEAAPRYPVECLGPLLGPAVLGIAEVVQCPLAVAAQSALAAVTLAVQGHADGIIDGRRFVLSEFFLTIAESGDRKSSADRIALGPVVDHQRHLWERYRDEQPGFEREQANFHASRKQVLGNAKLSAQTRALQLEALGAEPAPPLSPEILSQEPTLEGLIKGFVRGQPSRGLFNAEGGQFLGGHAMNRDNLLKTVAGLSLFWDGEPIHRTRAEVGQSFSLYGRRLSLHLMLQPTLARGLLGDPLLHAQGFLSRFLVAYPDSIAGTRLYRPLDPAQTPEIRRYWEALQGLLEQALPMRHDADGRPTGELEPPWLPLTEEAKALWVEAYDLIERKLAPGGALHSVRALGAKAAEHAVRLATVLALFHDPSCRAVPLDHLRGAVGLVSYYLNEGLRLYHVAAEEPRLSTAERLLVWLQRRGAGPISLPEIYQKGIAEVRNARKARELMRTLEEHAWVQPAPEGADYNSHHYREAWWVHHDP